MRILKNNTLIIPKDPYSSIMKRYPSLIEQNIEQKSVDIFSMPKNIKGDKMKKPAPRVTQPQECSAGIYLLYGDIDVDSMRDCSNWILSENTDWMRWSHIHG